jgi:hypothetical protein
MNLPIHVHSACATLGYSAPVLRAGQTQMVAQYSEESRRRRSVKANLAFVNGEGDHNLPPEDKDAAVDGSCLAQTSGRGSSRASTTSPAS